MMRQWLLLLAALLPIQQTVHASMWGTMLNRVTHPFSTQIHYRIGQVDPRFHLSDLQMKQLAGQAADIWQQGTGKQLFVYDPDARLTINMIYDQRQQQNEAQQQQQQNLQYNLSVQQRDAQYARTKQIRLETDKQLVETRQKAFQTHLNNYQQSINEWRKLGNVSADTRAQLEQEKNQLMSEQQALATQIEHYNQEVAAANDLSQKANQEASQYNQKANAFRTAFKPRQFEKGQFNGRTIDIYEYSTPADLRMTIAHEMGHALGLAHNNDPLALMYPVLEKQDMQHFKLKPADLAMLKR